MHRLLPLVLFACSQTTTPAPAAEPAGEEAPAPEEQARAEPVPEEQDPTPRCSGERRTDWERQELYRAVAGCVNATVSMLDGRDEDSLRRYVDSVFGMRIDGEDIVHEATVRVGGPDPIVLDGVEEWGGVGSVRNVRIRHPLSEGLSPVFADLCSLPCVFAVTVTSSPGHLLEE